MTDSPDIQNDQRRIEHIECLTAVLQDILTVDLMPNQSELLAIYGRVSKLIVPFGCKFPNFLCFFFLQMIVNAFNILDQEMNSIGTGIYLGVSITDHSCKPNAVATFDGTRVEVRTIEDFEPPIDWSKVSICLLCVYSL